MEGQPIPRATLVVIRDGRPVRRLTAGSGLHNEDGSLVTQEQFENLLGKLNEQGFPIFGLTAGLTPNARRGDELVLVTNDIEMAAARDLAERNEGVRDMMKSWRELIESGDIGYAD